MTGASSGTPELSRRQLVGLGVAGALAGGIWTTGLSILARGVHPQFFVIGEKSWQLVLVEHGQRRALIGLGEVPADIGEHVYRLTTTLRQQVDLVIGKADFLSRISPQVREWPESVSIRLDGSAIAGGSPTYIHLRDAISVGLGDMTLNLVSIPSGQWHRKSDAVRTHIVELRHAAMTVTFADSLDHLAEHARPESALAVAPDGDFERLRRFIPATGIVTNAATVPGGLGTATSEGTQMLIRTFRSDIASFRFRDGRIRLPDWAQRIED